MFRIDSLNEFLEIVHSRYIKYHQQKKDAKYRLKMKLKSIFIGINKIIKTIIKLLNQKLMELLS